MSFAGRRPAFDSGGDGEGGGVVMPIFGNPAGLWALLGVPAILAIHFLQQRAKIARTSTWFLIEKLAPDSARGRTWDRLRSSRALWLQLLSMPIAAWVLAEPRWVRAESAQTVAVVLDASASMEAFRGDAIAAADREMVLAEGLAARTTWVVMTTDPRAPALYRGTEREAATAAVARWQPELGQHDPGPALRLAHGLAGASGRTLLITDTRTKVPAGQRAAGVGRPIENVGFAGASITRDEGGGHTWRALVKNNAGTAQHRTWHLEAAGTKSAEQPLDLAPGALTEISARLPDGVDAATVVLSPDEFAADDRLPLVRPRPKPLVVQLDGDDGAAEFFRKLAGNVDGVAFAGAGVPATLRLARLSADEAAREPRGGVFWPQADQRAQASLLTDPVTPERDPLVAGLNWQGWFGTGPYGYAAAPGDTPLLWQGRWPLVFLRATSPAPGRAEGGRKLMLAFDWATSNASRLPAAVLLVRRFLEAERDRQHAPYTANFDCNGIVDLQGNPAVSAGGLTRTFQSAAGGEPVVEPVGAGERAELRAPGRAGFFTLKQGDELLVRGAAQFADARQGDFHAAEKFFIELPGERQTAIERNTRADPFAAGWLLALVAPGLGSWWTRGGSPRGSPASGEQREPEARVTA